MSTPRFTTVATAANLAIVFVAGSISMMSAPMVPTASAFNITVDYTDPVADFGGNQQRFELTNVDVAVLEDLGWDVIPEPSSMLLALVGALALLVHLRRRR